MKKQVIFMLLFSLVMAAFAFEKGTKALGGTLSLSYSKYDRDADGITNLNVAFDLGYCVIDNLMVEVSPRIRLMAFENGPTYNWLGLGVGARYFIRKFYMGSQINFFSSGFSGHKNTWDNLDLKVGYLLSLAKNIYLDLAAIYNIPIPHGGSDSSVLSLSISVAAFFKGERLRDRS